MPAVSVIVPLYNVEHYIEECIASLLSQTFGDFEVLCIDDGSTDESLSVARRTANNDPRFHFLSQSNVGQSAARNACLMRAQGEYVAFLDADDYYEPNTLGVLYAVARDEHLDDLFFSARTIYEDREVENLYRDEYDTRSDISGVMTGRELLVQFSEKDSFCVSPAMQFFRRDFLGKNNLLFFEGIIHEDNLFTCLALGLAQRTAFLNEPLYVRRVRHGSTMTQSRSMKHIIGHFISGYELCRWLAAQNLSSADHFAQALIHHIAVCYNTAAYDALEFDTQELVEHARTLDPHKSQAFYLHIIEHSKEMRGVRREYRDSVSFKVGRAITAFPRLLKKYLR